MQLLSGEIREGDTIVVDAGGDGLMLRVKERAEATAGAVRRVRRRGSSVDTPPVASHAREAPG